MFVDYGVVVVWAAVDSGGPGLSFVEGLECQWCDVVVRGVFSPSVCLRGCVACVGRLRILVLFAGVGRWVAVL